MPLEPGQRLQPVPDRGHPDRRHHHRGVAAQDRGAGPALGRPGGCAVRPRLPHAARHASTTSTAARCRSPARRWPSRWARTRQSTDGAERRPAAGLTATRTPAPTRAAVTFTADLRMNDFVKNSSRRWAAVTGIATAVLMGRLSVACSSTGTTTPTTRHHDDHHHVLDGDHDDDQKPSRRTFLGWWRRCACAPSRPWRPQPCAGHGDQRPRPTFRRRSRPRSRRTVVDVRR